MNKIYSLNWDYKHLGNIERDAFHIPFQNSDKSSMMFLNPRYRDKLPKQVLFKANFSLIPKIDYPLTDLNIPVFSDKMISIIKEIGNVEAIFTDVIMIDDNFLDDIYTSEGKLKPEILTNTKYKVITIVNREKCFDIENSIFQPSELNPEIPGFIEKLVLKSSSFFPPIFRIKESPSRLLITERVKQAFEKNNIEGCVFEEIETTSEIK